MKFIASWTGSLVFLASAVPLILLQEDLVHLAMQLTMGAAFGSLAYILTLVFMRLMVSRLARPHRRDPGRVRA